MVQLYVKRIRAGLMTIDDVPQRWRKAVEEALKE
jgi:hypothetical protein